MTAPRTRLILFVTLVLGGCGLAFSLIHWPAQADRREAERAWEQSRADLADIEARRSALEREVSALRTRTDIVELRARTQYRLIRPGERVEVLRYPEHVPVQRREPAPGPLELAATH